MQQNKIKMMFLLTLFASAWAACTQAQTPFKDLSYDQAVANAAQQKKLVFIDFYTTWCGPCKMLDQTTLKDAWVRTWLAEHTVALKIDAEKELKLAEKLKVEYYPTLIFLNSEGKQVERVSGYVSAKDFRSIARDLPKGITELVRTQQELSKTPNDPNGRLVLAAALKRKGLIPDAFKEYIWCLDNGTEHDPAFAQQRDGQVIEDLLEIAELHEPARDEMFRRRDAAERRILDDRPQPGDVALFAQVSLAFMDGERVLSTYDAVASRGAASPVLRILAEYAFPALLEAKRYDEIAKATDVPAKVDEFIREGHRQLAEFTTSSPDDDAGCKLIVARSVAPAAQRFQVLLGAGRADDARAVARKVLEFDKSPDTHHALAWEGHLSGKPIPECLEFARFALEKAAPDEKANVTDTVARLMDALGSHDEAVALCRNALAQANGDRDRWILETCVTELATVPPSH
jgi:thioredoxin-related protein